MLVCLTLFPRIIPENYLISLTKKIINQSCSEKEGYLYINENATNSFFVHLVSIKRRRPYIYSREEIE